jgi:hypothetical protein
MAKTLLITNIDWDTEGMKAVEDCNLPLAVLVVNAPDNWDNDEYKNEDGGLGDILSETYGFCHYGYEVVEISPDVPGGRTIWTQHKHLAIMQAPEANGNPLGTFGDFFHEVCEDLVGRHSWDDPYGSMSPGDHQELHSQFLDLIHKGYHAGSDSGYVAAEINKLNGGEDEE